jgi:hypothetical protein
MFDAGCVVLAQTQERIVLAGLLALHCAWIARAINNEKGHFCMINRFLSYQMPIFFVSAAHFLAVSCQ